VTNHHLKPIHFKEDMKYISLTTAFTPLLLLITLLNIPNGISKELAITFDDSPRAANGLLSGPERANKLVAVLAKHQVKQVAFFSVSKHLNSEGISRLNIYSDAGHLIANHSHDHPDFNTSSLTQYINNFLQADKQLKQFSTFTKMYRFPYLREGNTPEKRDGMRATLDKFGYKNAYITLNTYDWYIENLFQAALARGEEVNLERMKRFYVEVMMESIEYYDTLAVQHLNRSPKHVLLLHEMDISALFIGDLIDELRRRHWNIISPEQAYNDVISQMVTKKVLPYNPGRIGEIARDKGQKKQLWHKSLDETYLTEKFNKDVLLLKK